LKVTHELPAEANHPTPSAGRSLTDGSGRLANLNPKFSLEIQPRVFSFRRSRASEKICKRIAWELRNQYTIGYKPSNQKLDDSWRKVIVRVNPSKTVPKVKVRTKQGYYAPLSREATLISPPRAKWANSDSGAKTQPSRRTPADSL